MYLLGACQVPSIVSMKNYCDSVNYKAKIND